MNSPKGALGPIPPNDLLVRIGVSPDLADDERIAEFDRRGRTSYDDICAALPDDWSWDGRAILDFGCGSGRVLRWFAPHLDDGARLVGCDIHAETIEWMRAAYPDTVSLYVNGERPPLPHEDETFDLVFCGSVFSHLPDWAPWVLEMRRILKPGGLIVASIHGQGFWDVGLAGARGEAWDDDRTGLLVEHYGSNFHDSWGPAVYVSEWWVREHWGRAMEIVRFDATGFGVPEARDRGQALIVARRPGKGVTPSVEDLLRPSDDPRELPAALRGQWLAYEELGQLQGYLSGLRAELSARPPAGVAEATSQRSVADVLRSLRARGRGLRSRARGFRS